MRRRDFISLVGGAAALPLAARAQQPAVSVIGFLHATSAEAYAKELAGFQQGLAETGYVGGRNVKIEYRRAEGHYDRLPEMAAELARSGVAVIAAPTTPAALAAKKATDTIPIVFETGVDPVSAGLVSNLARPEGNVTGIFNLNLGLMAKRIEMMHEAIPGAKLIVVLLNPNSPTIAETETEHARAAQRQFGLQMQFLHASSVDDIDAAFAKAVDLRAGALILSSDALFIGTPARCGALAMRYGMPASHALREFVVAGGLMSYGSSFPDAYRLAGGYVGRILNGQKPRDLPVQQATKVEMVVNLKSAKALGIALPLPLLGRADEVIE